LGKWIVGASKNNSFAFLFSLCKKSDECSPSIVRGLTVRIEVAVHMSASDLFSHRPFWAKRLGKAPFLPRSAHEMEVLGWEACDVIIVTGDAYVDHPSFGMAVIGRLLEDQGFRVGILDQPDIRNPMSFQALGRPTLFFGVTGGNMDSLVTNYTSDKKPRSDDAYTPGGLSGARPDRACTVYTQRCREVYPDVPVILGGIEASLRRLAHYDYWSEKVRRSILVDSGADLLVYGNAERAIVEIAHLVAAGENPRNILDVRGTAVRRPTSDSGPIDTSPGTFAVQSKERLEEESTAGATGDTVVRKPSHPREKTAIRLPSSDAVQKDKVLYAHCSRAYHLESNPHNARCLVQRNGDVDIWINPPPFPLTTAELDRVFELPYRRMPHPDHQGKRLPAYEMIRFSVNIMRGCFGGCTFCSITEHEGRIIQSRSLESVVRELALVRELPGFTGQVSDLGGPTANMYRMGCTNPSIQSTCRKPSCVYPSICKNLGHDHGPLIQLYRTARSVPGMKKITIGSGLRYDLAVVSPEYIRELVSHHVGGYLKIAPEHVSKGPLSKMMKPGIAVFERFRELFEKYSALAGKEQYLIPYFIAAHPGTDREDMLEAALWLKTHKFRPDQVQSFLPSPMSLAAAMHYSGKNPLETVTRQGGDVVTVHTLKERALQKAFLRYHDAMNHPALRAALFLMGRGDLIGPGPKCLVPREGIKGRRPLGPKIRKPKKPEPRNGKVQ
jgi:uncharacterized radical SAM protein YgiQ